MKNLIQALKNKQIKYREYYTGPRFEFMEIFTKGQVIRVTPAAKQFTVEQSGTKPKKCKTEKEIINTYLQV